MAKQNVHHARTAARLRNDASKRKSEQVLGQVQYMDFLASLDTGIEGFSLDTPVYAAVNF